MNKENRKQRIVHELWEFLTVFLFLAPFFASFATYRVYLKGGSGELLALGIAMVNALVLAKIILIGEMARLGRRSENKPLFVSTIHKAIMFTMLYLAFHVLEEGVRGVLHGHSFFRPLVVEKEELLGIGLVLFFAMIPFFAMREMRRVMGADNFRHLFFGGNRPEQFNQPAVGVSGSRFSPDRVTCTR
ncbi:MAG TPA: hypothetical protein VIY49_20625 [Bryobacteraceae bacterium]